MPGIIEIWREGVELGVPVKFTVGEPPSIIDGGVLAPVEDHPVVKNIKHTHGAFGNAAYRGYCYIVTFVDSDVRRIIPDHKMVDIGYEVAKKSEPETPALEV